MQLHVVAPAPTGYALVLHGGAGGRVEELALDTKGQYTEGLSEAYWAGEAVLADGGSALDAVCVTVEHLENNPLFNSGRGAALTASGEAELDASVMTGEGHAGAVAASRYARNPVHLARKVMEESKHVFLVTPSRELLAGWGLEIVDPEYFITPGRQRQLKNVLAQRLAPPAHGTVGAAAVDMHGHVAAATSTGGSVGQSLGRVGDSPIIGAGTYAREGVVAISCTGEGEAFIQGVVAHDISARMRYLNATLAEAITATMAAELDTRDATGGIIAVSADGALVVAHNSPAIFAAYRDGGQLVTLT
jgi:beta-aspartyl-peptidase (threonine type)